MHNMGGKTEAHHLRNMNHLFSSLLLLNYWGHKNPAVPRSQIFIAFGAQRRVGRGKDSYHFNEAVQ